MQRAALNRSNPSPRLVTIVAAASRRQAATVPALVEGEVNEIAEELGTSIETINGQIDTVNGQLTDLNLRVEALETS